MVVVPRQLVLFYIRTLCWSGGKERTEAEMNFKNNF